MSAIRASLAITATLLASISIACEREQRETRAASESVPASAIASVDGAGIDAAEPALTGDLRRDRRALEALIARTLAAREARSRGLDAEATTRAKLEALHREAAAREEELLRDALFASLRSSIALAEADLRAHYEKTRTRHTERRVTLRRQRFASEAEARAAEGFASDAESIGPSPAEKLPADVIPEALRLRSPGERVVIARDGAAALVELVAIEPAAQRSFEEARTDVEESLRTLRAQEAFRAEIERLRAAAKIEIDEAALLRVPGGKR